MILFLPDKEEGYREISQPIKPIHVMISGYNPATVVELLAHLWAYPSEQHHALRLLSGEPAEVVCHRYGQQVGYPDDIMELVGLRWEYLAHRLTRSMETPVRFLHGCDIMCYAPGHNRRLLIEMLQKDRCFISMDPMSLTESYACMASDDREGLFVVHQWDARPFPVWSEDAWKAFGCQARPHIQFQFP